ncbi:hypothetical protein GCM10025862_35880 [Arsenicicoccus piscis]|uniref:Uncharacterized protein n=1 Tax=Arsenicicoccus piscis TaxID=673954 RepID=A0ABQ6HT58_9MICO|nr:hypothetical protein GCM10025862_35880 [Arsenicicoccus piscis]
MLVVAAKVRADVDVAGAEMDCAGAGAAEATPASDATPRGRASAVIVSWVVRRRAALLVMTLLRGRDGGAEVD